MVGDHLVDLMSQTRDFQNRAWVHFVQRLQRACQGRVAWPMRLTPRRFGDFIFALLDACWSYQEHELAKIQYLRSTLEREIPKNTAKSRRRLAECKPLEGFGPLVENMRTFLAAAKSSGSPWMMYSFAEEDDKNDDSDVYDDRQFDEEEDEDEDEGELRDDVMFVGDGGEDSDVEMTG